MARAQRIEMEKDFHVGDSQGSSIVDRALEYIAREYTRLVTEYGVGTYIAVVGTEIVGAEPIRERLIQLVFEKQSLDHVVLSRLGELQDSVGAEFYQPPDTNRVLNRFREYQSGIEARLTNDVSLRIGVLEAVERGLDFFKNKSYNVSLSARLLHDPDSPSPPLIKLVFEPKPTPPDDTRRELEYTLFETVFEHLSKRNRLLVYSMIHSLDAEAIPFGFAGGTIDVERLYPNGETGFEPVVQGAAFEVPRPFFVDTSKDTELRAFVEEDTDSDE